MRPTKFIRNIVFAVVVVAVLLTVLTGSPILLWHIEKLDHPVAVTSATATHLVLANGQQITLPFIAELPHENPLFQAAVSHGIEVSEDGTACGLMWLDRSCGNDPVVWRRVRVNLSDLAGALHPGGIDDSLVHPDAIAFLEEHEQIDLSQPSRSHRKSHLTVWDCSNMRAVREQFEYSAGMAKRKMP